MNRLEETPSLVTNTCSGEPAFRSNPSHPQGTTLLLHLPIDAENHHLHQRCAVDAQGHGITCWSLHQHQTRATGRDRQRRDGGFKRARFEPHDLNVIKALNRRCNPELKKGVGGFPATHGDRQQILGSSTHQMLHDPRMNALFQQHLTRLLPVPCPQTAQPGPHRRRQLLDARQPFLRQLSPDPAQRCILK